MTITVVGLGPGDPGCITAAGAAALRTAPRLLLRTSIHPGVGTLLVGLDYESCDDLYDAAPDFETLYARIVNRVIERATEPGGVCYAVPGSPLVGEATVRLLRRRAAEAEVPLTIVHGVSALEPVLAAVGADALDPALQVVDALDPRLDPQLPAVVLQVYNRGVLAALKLALLDRYPPEHPVVLVTSAGTREERCEPARLDELDRRADPDHLAALWLPALDPLLDRRTFGGFRSVVHRLYAPGGCPWDRQQTHDSLKRYVIEEAYELVEAIDYGDPAAVAEELGDLMLQVGLHTEIADEAGEFGYGEVFQHITDKLVRRHPHVFGDVGQRTTEEVVANWERLKAEEKPARESLLDGLPASMPALAYSQSVQGRAGSAGWDWPDVSGVLDQLTEELRELDRAQGADERHHEFGDVLFTLAHVAQHMGIDAEDALRRANRRFVRRFRQVERFCRERGLRLDTLDQATMDALWQEAKARVVREHGG